MIVTHDRDMTCDMWPFSYIMVLMSKLVHHVMLYVMLGRGWAGPVVWDLCQCQHQPTGLLWPLQEPHVQLGELHLQAIHLPLNSIWTINRNLEVSKVQIMKAKSLTYSHVAVWEFDVYIASGVAKSWFEAHTAMSWSKFEQEVMKHLDGAVMPVQLAYKIQWHWHDVTLERWWWLGRCNPSPWGKDPINSQECS